MMRLVSETMCTVAMCKGLLAYCILCVFHSNYTMVVVLLVSFILDTVARVFVLPMKYYNYSICSIFVIWNSNNQKSKSSHKI